MGEAMEPMTVRYERVEPCPDCTKGKHILESGGIVPCPGGSRTVIEPDYEAAALALWVYDSKATVENYGVWNHLTEQSREGYRRMALAAVNAALHLDKETPNE